MKKRKNSLILLMMLCIVGCGAPSANNIGPSEINLEQDTESPMKTILEADTQPPSEAEGFTERKFSADLTHDGQDDVIMVTEKDNGEDLPADYLISVYSGGNLIFELENYLHMALGAWYGLVKYNNEDYLMRYTPLVDHDMAICKYEVFSLDSSGEKVELDSDQIEISLWDIATMDKSEWYAFAEKENGYFRDASLVVSTLYGELECGDTDSPKAYEEKFAWMVDIMPGWNQKEASIDENLEQFISETISVYQRDYK